MKRGPYAKVAVRNAGILERIRSRKAAHPFWGYRRVWAHLKFVDGMTIGQNRVHRLMKENKLLVSPNTRLKAKRKVAVRKPLPTQPNQWWGIDMTKVMIDGFGWVYVVIVIDWYTKKYTAPSLKRQPRIINARASRHSSGLRNSMLRKSRSEEFLPSLSTTSFEQGTCKGFVDK